MLPYRHNTGFTLIEVLVAMIILAILAAFAIPDFLRTLPDRRLKAAARDLYTSIQDTKMNAIKENTTWAVIFDTVNAKYYICSDPGADNSWNSAADLTGTGDNQIEKTTDLSSYGSGVTYGHGTIANGNSVSGGNFPGDDISFQNNVLIINSRGTGNSGYAYLTNQTQQTVYAVGMTSTGLARLLRWNNAGGWN